MKIAFPSRTLIFAFGALACSPTAVAARGQESCPSVPAIELMSLPYDTFDTSEGRTSWRTLLERGCVNAAVATLEAYRGANGGHMTDEQSQELSFHIGQALAFSGREQESVRHFKGAIVPGSTAEWAAYVEATVGFIEKDRARVESAATRYQKLAGPESMRLAIIRGFLTCFDRPYKVAVHCSM